MKTLVPAKCPMQKSIARSLTTFSATINKMINQGLQLKVKTYTH